MDFNNLIFKIEDYKPKSHIPEIAVLIQLNQFFQNIEPLKHFTNSVDFIILWNYGFTNFLTDWTSPTAYSLSFLIYYVRKIDFSIERAYS